MLVEDERTGELRVQCQRQPPKIRTAITTDKQAVRRRAARARHDHPARRQRSPRRAARRDRRRGRRGASARAWARRSSITASHYGVVYVESKHAGVPPGGRRSPAGDRDAGRPRDPRDARRRAARTPREARARSPRRAPDPARLLPANVPQVVGLDFAVHYEPAYQIGGDFYDFIWHDPSHLGLAVGDVAGKAISAALYMARLTSRAALARGDRAHAGAPAPPRQPGDRDARRRRHVRDARLLHLRSRDAQPRVHERRPLRAAAAPRRSRVPAAGRARAHAAARRHARARGRRGARPAALRRHADHGVGRHPRGARRARQRVRAVAAVAAHPDRARQRRGRREGDPGRHRQPRRRSRPRATT